MPHLSFDYSANLEAGVDMSAFAGCLHDALLETGLFELGALRVRGFRCDVHVVADRLAQNGFIDMSLRMGEGRSLEDRQRAGEAIFAAACAFLAPQFASPHFMLSLEIREISAPLSWKRNAIHPRIRQMQTGTGE